MMTNCEYKKSLAHQLARAQAELLEARMLYRFALQMRDILAAEWERLSTRARVRWRSRLGRAGISNVELDDSTAARAGRALGR